MAKNNGKRKLNAGIFILFFASLIIFISGYAENAFSSCAGDCMTCHPKLRGDITHMSLNTCVNCHKPATKEKLTLSNGGCGDKCFQCHQQWPKDGSHASLNKCLDCHKK